MRSLLLVVVVVFCSCSPPVEYFDAGTMDAGLHAGQECAPRGAGACASSSELLVCEQDSALLPPRFAAYQCSQCTSEPSQTYCNFVGVPAGVACPQFAIGLGYCGTQAVEIRCAVTDGGASGVFRSFQCDGGCVTTSLPDGGPGHVCNP